MITNKIIRKIITGSLTCMITVMLIVAPQAALAASSHTEMSGLAEPVGVSEVTAENGIVRIQSGSNNEDGKFTAEKTFSGFVVSDDGSGGVFIVTTWHSVNTGKEPVVHVIVKNDTAVEAGVVAYSAEQDFCILSAGSMKGKDALPLHIPDYDEKSVLDKGSAVRALGFKSEADSGTEFSAADVTVNEGEIQDLSYENDSVNYISHSAEISGGLDGGPLVDENGYVIGVNNSKISDDDVSCALQIKEVDKLLDSNVILHRTLDKDKLYGELYELCDSSIDTYSRVKKADKEDLLESIQSAIEVMSEDAYDRSALQDALADLQKSLDSAELKTPKALYLIIALGLAIAALAAKLISLIMWNRKFEEDNPETAAVPEAPEKVRKENKVTGRKGPDRAKRGSGSAPAAPAKPAPAAEQAQAVKQTEPAKPAQAVKQTKSAEPELTVKEAEPVNPEKTVKEAAPAKPVEAVKPAVPSGTTGKEKIIVCRTGAEYELSKKIITIGRSREADISIEDNVYVARMHAMIENRKGAYFLHDMGSTNGTFLNGQPIKDEGIRLISGDVITVGNEEMNFI